MAYWLFWQKNTTGALNTLAHTNASFTSPWLDAPSPKYAMTASPSGLPTLPSLAMPQAYPVACSVCAPMTIVYMLNLNSLGSQPPWSTPRNRPSGMIGSIPRQ